MMMSVCLSVAICICEVRTNDTIRYEEFNVDSKAECDQLNLAHETTTKNASA